MESEKEALEEEVLSIRDQTFDCDVLEANREADISSIPGRAVVDEFCGPRTQNAPPLGRRALKLNFNFEIKGFPSSKK